MATKGQQPPIYIGVFGGPRAGKTSFIREVVTRNNSRLNLPPTTDVQLIKPLTIDGRQVVLFDTPAFYNRAARDLDSADVLKRLAAFLVRLQENGRRLSAIVFIHPQSNGPIILDSQRNLPVIRQIVGDGFLPNIIFVPTMWSNPPTPDQLSRDAQARAQEPFRSQIQRVNWASGPSPHGALDIVRMAMRKQPRQLAIQHEILDRGLKLIDTAAGQIVARNAKQIAQQFRSHGNAQGAQRAERVDGKLRQGFQQETNRWPRKPSQPKGAPAPRRAPAAKRGGHQHRGGHGPQPRGRGHAHRAPVRQQGPVAAPPMAYQPKNARNRNEIEMRQRQPMAQPPMQYAPPSVHRHSTHVHVPPAPQPQPTPPPNVYNNNSYYSYSYQENAPPPPAQTTSSATSYGGLAVGAGLVGGAALGYAAYEAFDDYDNDAYVGDDGYVDDDAYVDDPDLYLDDNDTGAYLADDDPDAYLGDDDNDPTSYIDDQPYDPDVGTSDLADDSQFQSYDPDPDPGPAVSSATPVDYSGDGGGGGGDDASGGGGGDDCFEVLPAFIDRSRIRFMFLAGKG
ncbi:hypothetical protein BDV93DRAFT_606336 [Ceratobasidium sp. AG-I]|nr:hypothetical protein BDV93DRAFT_606336 [Ceratobasidium sp. AG-I]